MHVGLGFGRLDQLSHDVDRRVLRVLLVIDHHTYWAMGERGDSDPIEQKTVINRAAAAS